jgi:hypothetical protein
VNLPAYCSSKKRARSEDGRKTTERISIHEIKAVVADRVPVKKLAEATNKEVSASGNRKKHGRYKNWSRKVTPDLRENLPPKKQVEVAYEETKVMSRMTIPDEQKGAVREDGRYAYQDESKSAQHNYEKRPAGLSDIKFRLGGDSDISISPRDGSNAQNKSMSYSQTIPTESFSYRADHHDNYMSHPTKEPYHHALSGAAYGNSYLESNHEYSGYRDIDGRSGNVSSFEDPGCVAPPTVDPYSSQFRGPDGSFYRQISEGWSPRASERYLVADIPMPGYPTRYGLHVGSRTPIATDLHTHPRMPGGTGTDGCLEPRYSLGSSGARSSQPPITPSFGLWCKCTARLSYGQVCVWALRSKWTSKLSYGQICFFPRWNKQRKNQELSSTVPKVIRPTVCNMVTSCCRRLLQRWHYRFIMSSFEGAS